MDEFLYASERRVDVVHIWGVWVTAIIYMRDTLATSLACVGSTELGTGISHRCVSNPLRIRVILDHPLSLSTSHLILYAMIKPFFFCDYYFVGLFPCVIIHSSYIQG